MKSTKDTETKCTAAFHGSRGVLLAFASGLLMSGAAFLVKYMPKIHPGQHAFWRCWVVASLSLPQLITRGENILGPRGHRISLLTAAFASASTAVFHFITVNYLPLGETAVLISSYPAFVTVGARIVLKEKFNFLQVVSVFLTIIGMILTTGLHKSLVENSGAYSKENLYGFAAGVTTIFTIVVTAIIFRKLRKVHFSVILFQTGVLGVIESFVFTTAFSGSFRLPSDNLQRCLIILLALLSYLGLLCVTLSLKYGKAAPISLTRACSEIFFSFLWQVLIFGDFADGMTILGVILVCFSVIFVAFNEKIQSLICKNSKSSIECWRNFLQCKNITLKKKKTAVKRTLFLAVEEKDRPRNDFVM